MLLLLLQLDWVGNLLEAAAAAGREVLAGGLHPVRRLLERFQLLRTCTACVEVGSDCHRRQSVSCPPQCGIYCSECGSKSLPSLGVKDSALYSGYPIALRPQNLGTTAQPPLFVTCTAGHRCQ